MKNNQYSDWLKENGTKLKTVYSYMVVNKLNIISKKDVLKALQEVDPEKANDKQTDIYVKMLQLFGKTFRNTIKKKLEG